MWVFGYGSLMCDNWENKNGRRCIRTALAELRGYRRIFNKRSVRHWGTQSLPCPTLNLERADSATCRGTAFEFQDNVSSTSEVLAYLRRREACDPCELLIQLDGSGETRALVYIYMGNSLIGGELTPERLAEMVVSAKGTDGICTNYIKGIAEKLAERGIHDLAVVDLWRAVRAFK